MLKRHKRHMHEHRQCDKLLLLAIGPSQLDRRFGSSCSFYDWTVGAEIQCDGTHAWIDLSLQTVLCSMQDAGTGGISLDSLPMYATNTGVQEPGMAL